MILRSSLLACLLASPAAAANLDQREPGSLVLFPEFDNRAGTLTVFTLTNTDATRDVTVEIIYRGRRGPGGEELDCLEFNESATLTPLDTWTFDTRTSNPEAEQGFAYAFAKDAVSDEPVAFDHLIAHSIVVDGMLGLQYASNPLVLRSPIDELMPTDTDFDGLRDLDGREYEMVADTLHVPRFFGQTDPAMGRPFRGDLVLVALSGGLRFETILNFTIYNDSEEGFSAQHRFTCWDKVPLMDISNAFGQDFLLATSSDNSDESLGAHEYGWFSIDGNVANSFAVTIQDPAFAAVYVERILSSSAADLPFEVGKQDNGDLLPKSAGGDTTDPGPMFVTFDEDFTTQSGLDVRSSGAFWDEGVVHFIGSGVNQFGHSGGTGRLGALRVRAGETIVLNTDSQDFPLPTQTAQIITNVPVSSYDPANPATWPRVTVTDGIFEFSSLVVEAGGTLRLEGSAPARVLARGDLVLDGTIDVAGESAPPHDSSLVYPAPGGRGGPFGGRGGSGATRINNEGNPRLLTYPVPPALGDGAFPGDPVLGLVGTEDRIDGQDGESVGRFEASMVGFPNESRGRGGLHWPDVLPTSDSIEQSILFDGSTMRFSLVEVGAAAPQCRVAQVAQPGSGGAYASPGGPGVPSVTPAMTMNHVNGGVLTFPPESNTPAPSAGGDTSNLFFNGSERTLYVSSANFPELDAVSPYGALRGGSGGGGAGAHLFYTPNNSCAPSLGFTFLAGGAARIPRWYDHSGASGGGGGGALQLTAGSRMEINGPIDARGGNGGSSLNPQATFLDTDCIFNSADPCGDFASPGGGGSGGAILLQAREVAFAPGGQVLDVRGGLGGQGVGFDGPAMTGSRGGDGGHGLVRIEDRPLDLGDRVDLATALGAILPAVGGDPANIVTLGAYGNRRSRPESYSGSASCWFQAPSGLELTFEADDPMSEAPENQGWNLTLLLDDDLVPGTPPVAFPYRGVIAGQPTGALSFEDVFGNTLNQDLPMNQGSVFAVRFQGARATGELADPCNVELDSAEIVPGSLTPWVQHPADLNQFSPRPNIVRVVFLFDVQMFDSPLGTGFENRIRGFTDLRIRAQTN